MSARFARSARCLIGVFCNERLLVGSRASRGEDLGDDGKDLDLRGGVTCEGATAVEVEAMVMVVRARNVFIATACIPRSVLMPLGQSPPFGTAPPASFLLHSSFYLTENML